MNHIRYNILFLLKKILLKIAIHHKFRLTGGYVGKISSDNLMAKILCSVTLLLSVCGIWHNSDFSFETSLTVNSQETLSVYFLPPCSFFFCLL